MPQPSRALDPLIGAAGSRVLTMAGADVGDTRERKRRQRWVRLAAVVWALVAVLWWRALAWDGGGGFVPLPSVDPFLLTIIVFFGLLLAMAVGQQVVSGRSPHVLYRPEQLSTTLDDVVGIAEQHGGSSRGQDADIASVVDSRSSSGVGESDALVHLDEPAHQLGRPVARAVVGDDDLDVRGVLLREERLELV